MTHLAEIFWDFSVQLYSRPGVADACLRLQDDCDADVNVLLLCCWLGARGQRLSADQLRAAVSAATPWQRDAIQPLRALRRRLKAGVAGVPHADSEALRQTLAAAELDAEKTAQQLLCASLQTPALSSAIAPAERRTQVWQNLMLYWDTLARGTVHCCSDEFIQALNTLAAYAIDV